MNDTENTVKPKPNPAKLISFCGIIAAFILAEMMFVSVFPAMKYAAATIAGIIMCIVAESVDKKWAVVTFSAVSLLGILIGIPASTMIMFVTFYGYYPIVVSALDGAGTGKKMNRVLAVLIELVIFNIANAVSFFVLVRFFGDTITIEGLEQYAIPVFLVLSNVCWLVNHVSVMNIRKKVKVKKIKNLSL